MTRPTYEADRRRIVLSDPAGGKTRTLTEGWDRSPESLAWTGDGRRLGHRRRGGAAEDFAVDCRGGRADASRRSSRRAQHLGRDHGRGNPVHLHDSLRLARSDRPADGSAPTP
jgi:hypothetical protein